MKLYYVPQDVEDVPVWIDPDENVGHGDKLKVGLFGIGEEDLWLPDGLDKPRVCQVHGRSPVFMRQTWVPPLLSQVGVSDVVLGKV